MATRAISRCKCGIFYERTLKLWEKRCISKALFCIGAAAVASSVGKINLRGKVRLDPVRIFLMRGDEGEEKKIQTCPDGWFDTVIRMLTIVVISNEQ